MILLNATAKAKCVFHRVDEIRDNAPSSYFEISVPGIVHNISFTHTQEIQWNKSWRCTRDPPCFNYISLLLFFCVCVLRCLTKEKFNQLQLL